MAAKKTTPKTPTKKSNPVAPKATASIPPHFATTSGKSAYEHFLPLAKAIPTDGLDVCRTDIEIARINIERGVDAIRQHLDTLAKKLPQCPVSDLLELPAISLALLFASGKISKTVSSGEIEKRLAALRPLREAALKQLEVFALLGMIPTKVPTGIRKGSGPLDTARDAVALPGAFHDHRAEIGDQHPFTPALLVRLGGEGDWLVKQLKPVGAKAAATQRDPASLVRDQLWAIINERYDELRQAGAVVFGLKSLDEHIPPLGARVAATTAAAAAKKSNGAGAKGAPAAVG
jgi:hypothetical protein